MKYSQPFAQCQPTPSSLVDRCLNFVQGVLWSPTCVLCRGRGVALRDLCAACEGDLPLNQHSCRICAQPLATRPVGVTPCGACLRATPHFDSSFVPYRYAYPLDRLIQRLKYGRDLSTGRVLGELLAHRLRVARPEPLPACIIPVPLAARRYRMRGYNQAIELASRVGKVLRVEVRADLAVRTRETQEQAALARKERHRNVRGAFTLARALPYRHVAILDDVVTTGSTVNELAKELRRAGAEKIEVWAIARTGR